MKDLLRNILEQHGTLTIQDMIMHIVVAAILGGVIYVSYAYTHAGTTYSKKFNISLMTLTVLTATVMTVIGNNVALSLGMVGALSVVRFRTAVKDSRDTTYIFWTIVVGICCGVGDYIVAMIGSSVIFLLLLIWGRVKNENRMLLIVRANRELEVPLEGLFFQYFNGHVVQRVKNTKADMLELIFEVNRRVYDKYYSADNSLVEQVYRLGEVDYFNVVTQSDDING
ncbi:DUF4956 domain-containing protein [Streptococcus suis]|uniref:DUF4956 domain-containing protein n=1 Tax=Streptococcus suis TaxID=1307 RepID=UPI000CF578D6|nr:DUF4956 domain-containing protein [Streptococcus suis]MBS8101255.1 DUF4956 domain-containing protein [Streptococcus suis]MDW8648760.1 DUF4956 domain-containing protein [Streptococcus suis]